MSNTPKTDNLCLDLDDGFAGQSDLIAFARDLERENAALRDALKRADLALDNLGIGRAAPVRVIARNALRKEAQP